VRCAVESAGPPCREKGFVHAAAAGWLTFGMDVRNIAELNSFLVLDAIRCSSFTCSFSLAWAVIGICWALWWSRRRRLASISLTTEV
jgi:hypothetical protein